MRALLVLSVLFACAPMDARAYVCTTPVNGEQLRNVSKIEALPDGDRIVFATSGAYRYRVADGQLESLIPYPPSRGAPPNVLRDYPLEAGGWFVQTEDYNLYYIDAAAKDVHAVEDRGLATIDVDQKAPGSTFMAVEEVYPLDGGGWLVDADNGLFRIDAAATGIGPIAAGQAGSLQKLSSGEWLYAAALAYRLDSAGNISATLEGPSDLAGGFTSGIYALQGANWLIKKDNGLFLVDPAATKFEGVANSQEIRINEVVPLPAGGVLILSDEGVLRFDLQSRSLSALQNALTGAAYSPAWPLHGGGWLFQASKGLFVVAAAGRSIQPVARAPSGDLLKTLPVENFGWLVEHRQGVAWIDAAGTAAEPMDDAGAGSIFYLNSLGNGLFLIQAENGLFRLTGETHRMEPIEIPEEFFGSGTVHPLKDGGWLFAGSGLFQLDAEARRLTPITDGDIGYVREMFDLGGGGWLLHGDRGGYWMDAAASEVRALGGPETGAVTDVELLPSGTLLVAAADGLFATIPSYESAEVTLDNKGMINGRNAEEISIPTQWTLKHECAPVAENLALWIEVTAPNGEVSQVDPQRIVVEEGKATIDANVAFPTKGDWKLQLASGASGALIPISGIETIAIQSGVLDWFQRQWKFLVASSGSIYLAIFIGLLLLSRRSPAAFRILSDPLWSKVGIWPFFLLRQVPAAQRWVLQPWFANFQKAVPTDRAFLDVPAVGPDGVEVDSAALIEKMRQSPRLWLQGRAGMGKSSVFAAWERAYFGSGSLSAAARTFGAILVTIPVRQFAALPAEPNNPENWVIQAARRRLEQFGIEIADATLMRAMLKSGAFALALDGMNEADRDAALIAFARAFPQVRLLVTSQSDGPDEFQTWRLPRDVSAHASGLLRLWLGEERGKLLSDRIAAEGLLQHLQSGYDLRLLADLARSDPANAKLPADRIGLYNAVLTEAVAPDGTPLPLENLKALAWAMLTEARRDIRAKDVATVGDALLGQLEKKRIVRRIGEGYEFRHDQMRSFLAVLWLTEESPNVATLIQRLEKSPVWNCSRRDQEEAWTFIAILLKQEDLLAIWRFTLSDPSRAFLQAALFSRAQTTGQALAA